jgi:hypothetical protein
MLIEQAQSLSVFPSTYDLIERAARLQSQAVADFVLLAAYLRARDFMAEQKALFKPLETCPTSESSQGILLIKRRPLKSN